MAQAQTRQEDPKVKYERWLIDALPTDSTNANHPLNEKQPPLSLSRTATMLYELMIIVRSGPKNDTEKTMYNYAVAKLGGSKDSAARALTDSLMRCVVQMTKSVKSQGDAGQYASSLPPIFSALNSDMTRNPEYFREWLFIKPDMMVLKDRIEGKAEALVPAGTQAARARPTLPLRMASVDTSFFVLHGNAPVAYNLFTGKVNNQMIQTCGADPTRASTVLDAFLNAKSYLANFPSGGGNASFVGNSLANALQNDYAHGNPEKLAAVQPAIDLARKGDVKGALNALGTVVDIQSFLQTQYDQYQIVMLPTAISVINLSANVRVDFKGADDFQNYLDRARQNPGFLKPLYAGLLAQYDHLLLSGRLAGAPGAKEFNIGSGDAWSFSPYLGFNASSRGTPLILEASVTFRTEDIHIDSSLPIIGAGGANLGNRPYSLNPPKDLYLAMTRLELKSPGFADDRDRIRHERTGVMMIEGSPKNPLMYTTWSARVAGGETDSVHILVTPRLGFLATKMFGPTSNTFWDSVKQNWFVGSDVSAVLRRQIGEEASVALIPSIRFDYFPNRQEGRYTPMLNVAWSPARWFEVAAGAGYSKQVVGGEEGPGRFTAQGQLTFVIDTVPKRNTSTGTARGSASATATTGAAAPSARKASTATAPAQASSETEAQQNVLTGAATNRYREALSILDGGNTILIRSEKGTQAAKDFATALESFMIMHPELGLNNDPQIKQAVSECKSGNLEAIRLIREKPLFVAAERGRGR